MADVIGQLCQSRSPMLMANGRAGGRQVTRWLLEDHFAQIPDEIRREHSLRIVSDLPLKEVMGNLFSVASGRRRHLGIAR